MEFIANEKKTLLDLLVENAPDSPKARLKGWIRDGRVCINGRVIKKGTYIVDEGEQISIGKKRKFLDENLEILFDDHDIVVVHKPAGLLSVDTDDGQATSAHRILKRQPKVQKVYPVHRIDRDTSGVLVFAYSERARDGLKEQFFDHSIDRIYCAIVEGKPDPQEGTWISNLIEDENYVVRSTKEGGKRAVTHFRVTRVGKRYSLLEVKLETGRKNQIRVHCSDAGHPIVGDEKYGALQSPFKRLGLHAQSLGFIHPVTKKKLSFKVPLPTCFLSQFSR
ncbi:MAG: RluA family pseudouridine synthase [Simkaniaceae bacterium]|nr:RluA family pseudouridine synthase [Simkaniaceae bacterium]